MPQKCTLPDEENDVSDVVDHSKWQRTEFTSGKYSTCWISRYSFDYLIEGGATTRWSSHSGKVSWPWPSATLTMHSQAHKLTSEILHSFLTSNTYSRSCLITPNPIACTYLLLVLVPCLSLPHIRYPTSTSFPPSVSLSSPSLSTLYHLTLNCLPSYPHYILHFSPYIQSPIPNLSQYVSLPAHSISSYTLVPSSSVW